MHTYYHLSFILYVCSFGCVCVSSCVLQIGAIYKWMHGYPCIFAVWLVRNSNHAFPSTSNFMLVLSLLQHLDAFDLVQSWLSTVHLIFRRLSQVSLSSKDGITLGGEDSIGSDSWGWPWAAANSVDPRGKAMMEVILQRFCYQSTSTCRDSPHDGTLPNWALRIMEYDEWHDLLYSKVRLYWFMKS